MTYLSTTLAFITALFFLVTCTSPPCHGHGEADLRITTISQEIADDPLEADLYVKRGNIHRIYEHWDEAIQDYVYAQELEPNLDEINLFLSKALLGAGRLSQALEAISLYIESNPTDANALFKQARILGKLGQYVLAANTYRKAIERIPNPSPDCFIEQANALIQAGPTYTSRAIQELNKGIERCGPAISLIVRAIDLEVEAGSYDAALQRLDRLLALPVRKDQWLSRKGDILMRASRQKEAHATYQQALQSIETLPRRHRHSTSSQTLEQRLRKTLQHWDTQ